MLFKRKSGKIDPARAQGNLRSDQLVPPERSAPHEDDGFGEKQDVRRFNNTDISSSTNAKKRNPLDDTRRAVAQKRASKKLSSVDWDIAAREEITALFSDTKDTSSNQRSTDGDLETVRKAIAKRKAKGDVKPPTLPEDLTDNSEQRNTLNNIEDDNNPRLDWLVDFISDDSGEDRNENVNDEDEHRKLSNDVRAYPRHNRASDANSLPGSDRKSNAVPGNKMPKSHSQASSPRSGIKPDDIEIVFRADKDLDVESNRNTIAGDGFGELGAKRSRNSENHKITDNRKQEFSESIPIDRAKSRQHSQVSKKAPSRRNPFNEESSPREPSAAFEESSGPPVREIQETEPPVPGDRSLDFGSLRSKDRVVGLLLKKQIVTTRQVYEAQKIKERDGLKETLWRILVGMDGVDREAIFEEAARIYAFPVADVEGKLDAKFVRSVLETLSEKNRERLLNLRLVPFESETGQDSNAVKLVFVTHDPMRTEVRRVMKELKLDRFDLYYAPQSAVESIIKEAFPRKNEYLERMTEDPMAFDLGMSYEDADLIDEDALEAEISRSSLINLFEATLIEAVRHGASDVHIYPNAQKKVEIHFRVDGRLTLWHTEHKVHPEALLAVIKDNAMNVDRFERDAAQDGYIQRWIDDVLIRFRVSVLPIANISHEIRSESIVIRVLDDRKVIRDLRKLGLLEGAMVKFEQAISQPHGMVILTGPTGSGKSTTLVAALHQVITGEVNVLTVEDPVEYIIPGVRQIKLNYKLELENALRAILRHDPDVVMVGEMRDRKTAELAIKLANTGHLTFSTLHTNDAPSAISRLYKMGIEPFLIAYAINLIVAQRLIRTLCSNCKQPDLDPDPVLLEKLGFSKAEISNLTYYLPGNDDNCRVCKGVGYKGRRAVSEALYFSREIRHMIVEADKMIDEGRIKEQAMSEGMLTLQDSAREIVKLGETSVREMIRVVTTHS